MSADPRVGKSPSDETVICINMMMTSSFSMDSMETTKPSMQYALKCQEPS